MAAGGTSFPDRSNLDLNLAGHPQPAAVVHPFAVRRPHLPPRVAIVDP
jgi:hypothetical protein